MTEAFKDKNVILICGDEEYLRNQKKEELLKALDAEGSPNFNRFEGEELDLDEIAVLAMTAPFFEPLRKILIIDSGLFKKEADKKDKKEKIDKTENQRMAEELIAGLPEQTVIIFYEKNADAASPLYKMIKKIGNVYRFDSEASVKGLGKSKTRSDIRNWIRDSLAKENRTIDGSAANYLVQLAGYDMRNLSTEMEKLICYTLYEKPGYRITRKEIDAICSQTVQDRIFAMMGHILKREAAEALKILEELFSIKMPPMRIIRMFGSQCYQALNVKECMANGMSDAEVMRAMGFETKEDWRLRNIKEQIRTSSYSDLRKKLELTAELEYKVKIGDLSDKLAAELLVIC